MLGGKMSNEDEDEVEDELLAMQREANGVPAMPDAPTRVQEPMPDVPGGKLHEARRQEESQQQRTKQALPA